MIGGICLMARLSEQKFWCLQVATDGLECLSRTVQQVTALVCYKFY